MLPIGIQQAEQTGESILFLLETNPGPGFGVLLACYICKKERRNEYLSSIFVELIGGVHEVYFPVVLSNIWLIFALIGGGAAGNLCFSIFHTAATGAISPGSIVVILLLSTKNNMIGVVLGIFVSAIVSAVTAIFILKLQEKLKYQMQKKEKQENGRKYKEQTILYGNMEDNMVQKVGVICNAGVGSSAIGAALFRRKLKELNITEIEVAAYAADQIPEDVKIVICQKDFKELTIQKIKADVYTIENLLNQTEYLTILKEIQRKGGKEKWI